MSTLVMVETIPGVDNLEALQFLVHAQLTQRCSGLGWSVAACTIGTECSSYLEIAREVEDRAHQALSVSAARRKPFERCGYFAIRSIPIALDEAEEYEMAALYTVFRNNDRIIRRQTIADLEEDIPDRIRTASNRAALKVEGMLQRPRASLAERLVAQKIQRAVEDGFRDYSQLGMSA